MLTRSLHPLYFIMPHHHQSRAPKRPDRDRYTRKLTILSKENNGADVDADADAGTGDVFSFATRSLNRTRKGDQRYACKSRKSAQFLPSSGSDSWLSPPFFFLPLFFLFFLLPLDLLPGLGESASE
jgi:hypothetical protein